MYMCPQRDKETYVYTRVNELRYTVVIVILSQTVYAAIWANMVSYVTMRITHGRIYMVFGYTQSILDGDYLGVILSHLYIPEG
jgi:hypothetical protein